MAARGRGRGRGRGAQMSFDYSQLGFSGGEALPAPVLQPPPTFPLLEHKPVPLKSGPEAEYMVALKRDFVEYLHSIRQNNDSSSTIERFSDKYQMMSSETKDSWNSGMRWDFYPVELNPKGKKGLKRKVDKTTSAVSEKKPNIDITKKLDELAKLEVKEEDDEEEAKEAEDKDADDDNENRENLEEEDEDEEMDDGTDYVNNYFDNGEGYFDDEDDNLDDGPVY